MYRTHIIKRENITGTVVDVSCVNNHKHPAAAFHQAEQVRDMQFTTLM